MADAKQIRRIAAKVARYKQSAERGRPEYVNPVVKDPPPVWIPKVPPQLRPPRDEKRDGDGPALPGIQIPGTRHDPRRPRPRHEGPPWHNRPRPRRPRRQDYV